MSLMLFSFVYLLSLFPVNVVVPLQKLFSSNTNEFLRECQGNALLEADPNRSRSRLNDRERRQAALPILVFGSELVSPYKGCSINLQRNVSVSEISLIR